MYKVDINGLGFEFLMPHRRLPKYFAFLKVALFPIRDLYSKFIEYRKDLNYELAITAEVSSLEYYVNSLFDLPYVLANRNTLIDSKQIIYLKDTSNLPYTWLGETNNFLLGDTDLVYLADSEAYELHNHYIVMIPQGLTYNSIVLEKEIKKFNHVNRKFALEEY